MRSMNTIVGSRYTHRRIAALGVLALLAGCATYRARPIDPTERARDFSDRSLDGAGVAAFARQNGATEWPPKQWDLDALTLAAFYYHPDLDTARARYAIARAGIVTAGARPNPTASLGLRHTAPSREPSPWTIGFNFDLPVETAGKRGYRLRRARALSDAGRLMIAAVAWEVRSRLRGALADYTNASETVDLLTRQQEIQSDIVGILRKRLDYGEGSLLEATRAQISAAQTTLQLRDAERRREEGRARIAEAAGIPLSALDGIDLVPFTPQHPPASDLARNALRTAALTGRADLRALLAEYEAAESALRLEIAKQYPDLHLGPGYAWDQGASKWSLGFSAELPVLNQNQGPIAEAEARRREVAARFDALQAKVAAGLDHALASYRGALAKLESARAALTLNEQQERNVRRRLEAGETDRLDLRTNELQTNISALAVRDAAAAVDQSMGAIEDSLERPLTSSGVNPASAAAARPEEKP